MRLPLLSLSLARRSPVGVRAWEPLCSHCQWWRREQPSRAYFWEPTKRGDWKYDVARRQVNEMTIESIIYYGHKVFWEELVRWVREWRSFLHHDLPYYEEPREENVIWKFDNEDSISQWIVSKDSDWGEGFSTATFERSPAGHGIFHGFLDTKTFPKDRTITRVGWTFASCPPATRPFGKEGYYEWHAFTHMVLRVRGDGRTYAISIRTPGQFNLTAFDVYTFGLYTTGGPYWQYVRIPFSRFIFTNKGAVQDVQEPIDLCEIRSFGIGCMDKIHGPFRLEIDSIALSYDPTWEETCQYEKYYIPQSKYAGY